MNHRSFLLLAVVCTAFACTAKKSPMAFGIPMEDSLFLDKAPLNNISYNEYLHYLINLRSDTAVFEMSFPDTTLLIQRHPGFSARHIMKHPNFRDSTLVGISHDKALAYIRWRTEVVRIRLGGSIWYSLPSPEDFKKAERLAAGRTDKNNWKQLFEGPPELTNVPGYVWVKSKEGGRLVPATEVPAHEIGFRCKAELLPWTGSSAFY
jgi:hypothetical protein